MVLFDRSPFPTLPNNAMVSEVYEKSWKLVSHIVNSNIAINSLPTLQISLEIVALFEKIYAGQPILTVFSNIGKDVRVRCTRTIPFVQGRILCEKCVAARHFAVIWKQLLISNDRNRLR